MITYAEAICSLAALVAFLVFFYWPWQLVMADVARAIVFEARDSIFDMAANGELDFNSAEYQTIRRSLQTLIRFAHTATVPNLIWHSICEGRAAAQRRQAGERSELADAISRIENPQTARRVKAIVDRAQRSFVGAMGVRSLLIVIPTVLVGVPYIAVDRSRRAINKALDKVSVVIEVEAKKSGALGL